MKIKETTEKLRTVKVGRKNIEEPVQVPIIREKIGKIPCVIDKSIIPEDRTPMTLKQLKHQLQFNDGVMWLSLAELRRVGSDFRIVSADKHDSEWLCCGAIPKSRIESVMPYDGDILHRVKPEGLVWSKYSAEKWVFNYDITRWRLPRPEELAEIEKAERQTCSRKRKDIEHGVEDGGAKRQNTGTAPIDEDTDESCSAGETHSVIDTLGDLIKIALRHKKENIPISFE